jgi:hypothetical protein
MLSVDDERAEDAIVADQVLVRAMTRLALNLADSAQHHRLEKGLSPLSVGESIAVAARMMWLGFRSGRAKATAVSEMRAKGVDPTTIAEFVMADVRHRALEEATIAHILAATHLDDALDYLALAFSRGEHPLSRAPDGASAASPPRETAHRRPASTARPRTRAPRRTRST